MTVAQSQVGSKRDYTIPVSVAAIAKLSAIVCGFPFGTDVWVDETNCPWVYQEKLGPSDGVNTQDALGGQQWGRRDNPGKVGTVASIRNLPSNVYSMVSVTSYAVLNDGGGGVFYPDSSDTTSADNGGTIIVSAGGTRWKRQFSGSVNVRWFGARGDDTTNDYPAIAATIAAVVLLGGGAVFFPVGIYKHGTTITVANSGVRLVGDTAGPGGASVSRLHFTGAGDCVYFDGGAAGPGILHCGISNLVVAGNAAATNGVHLRGCHHSDFSKLRVTNVVDSGVRCDWAVSNVWYQYRCSLNEEAFTTTPTYGLRFSRRGVGEFSAAASVINPIIEGTTNGIFAEYAQCNHVHGGTIESCPGTAIIIGVGGNLNEFESLDLESNGLDVSVAGFFNKFINVLYGSGAASIAVLAGAYSNVFLGGDAYVVTNAGFSNSFDGIAIQTSFTDTGTNTYRRTYNVGLAKFDATRIPNRLIALSASVTPGDVNRTLSVGVDVDPTRALNAGIDTSDVNFGGVGATPLGTAYVQVDKPGVAVIPLRLNPGGGGTAFGPYAGLLRGILTATANLDFPNVPANTTAELTVALVGAAVGDLAVVSSSNGLEAGLMAYAYVSVADVVTVRLANVTVAAINPAARDFRVVVTKY